MDYPTDYPSVLCSLALSFKLETARWTSHQQNVDANEVLPFKDSCCPKAIRMVILLSASDARLERTGHIAPQRPPERWRHSTWSSSDQCAPASPYRLGLTRLLAALKSDWPDRHELPPGSVVSCSHTNCSLSVIAAIPSG